MVLFETLLDHYIMFAEILGLWFMLEAGVHVKRQTVLVTKGIIVSIFVEALLWSIEFWTRSFTTYTVARPLLTATIYLLHSMIILEMMNMSALKKKGEWWLYIPLWICFPVFYTSQWTRLIFYYDENNLYHAVNAVVAFIPYYVFFFYGFIFAYRFFRHYSYMSRKDQRGIIYGVGVALIGVILHVVAKRDVDYSTLFSSVLMLYYLFLYMNGAKTDPLTKLLNRQCYYADIQKEKDSISAVVSVDMNDLKLYNDNYGHDAGDTALKTVSECLTWEKNHRKKVYRTGGDEFIILYFATNEQEVRDDIQKMKDALAKTKYVCAFGYNMRQDEDNIDLVTKEADAKMYADKAALKDTKERRLAAHKIATIEVMHEALHSGMWGMEFDEQGKMCSVEWSQQFRKMIGYKDETDFPNELEAWSKLVHPDEREAVLKAFHDTINDYSNKKTYDVEYRLKTKDGQWRWFHAIGRLLRRENGVPLSYVGMFVDITEKKQMNS
ncbi:MAG: PAS domain-containing protein [Lachnospiraceae bacterium]|nr:PAS domain-containing protein [Lachnospiraceae bacterium]